MRSFTPEEEAALHLTSDLWNAFLQLPTQHPDDQTEFRHGIHALQRIILARPTFGPDGRVKLEGTDACNH